MSESQAPGQNIPGLDARGALDVITRQVVEDEPCYLLVELNLQKAPTAASPSTELHRFQVLKVVRNDSLVTAYIDLGPARAHKADEITIPGGEVGDNGRGYVFATVGELREIADEIREGPLRREQEPTDLQGAWNEFNYQRKRFASRESTYGYGGQLVRA